MKTKLGSALRLLGVGALFLSMLTPVTVSAHEEATTTAADSSTTTTTTAAPAGNNYSFKARKNDSLTVLSRRALQLYQADKKMTLEPAAAIYCETVMAQALGGNLLEIGQQVDIPVSLIETSVGGSKTLTQAQLAGWKRYAADVNFEVTGVQVVAAPAGSTAQTPRQQSGDEETPTDEAEAPKDTTPDAKDSKNAGVYWWFIGAGVLVALYFVLGGPTPRMRRS